MAMLRLNAAVIGCGLLIAASAAAQPDPERPMQLELGLNTRHYAASAPEQGVAFRSSVGEPETGQPEGTAVTTSLRFTGKTRYNTFLGVEAEMGAMLGRAGSNVAGAYGVAGLRNDLGALRLAAELVAGRRWIRYDLDGGTDPTRMVAEPRVRADLWLAPQVTLGGAVGATLGDDAVWMAGIYVGLHSQPYAATR